MKRYLLACLTPPLAVYLCGGTFMGLLINVLLTGFGWLPGVFHAAWWVSSFDRSRHEVWAIRHLNGVNEPSPVTWPFVVAFPLALVLTAPLVWLGFKLIGTP